MPNLRLHEENLKFTRLNLHKLMMELKKNSIFQFIAPVYWSAVLICLTCAVLFGGMKNQHIAILEPFGTKKKS